MGTVRPYAGYILDLDGTVYLGRQLIPGADTAIAALRGRGARVMFVSNKPIDTRANYAAKLSGLGIPTGVDDVLTSPLALADYIREHHEAPACIVVGEAPVLDELRNAGCRIVSTAAEADIVLARHGGAPGPLSPVVTLRELHGWANCLLQGNEEHGVFVQQHFTRDVMENFFVAAVKHLLQKRVTLGDILRMNLMRKALSPRHYGGYMQRFLFSRRLKGVSHYR